MKNITKIFLIITSVLLMGSGCEEDQPDLNIKSCNLLNSIKSVSDKKGTIWFQSSTKSYVIFASIEGSYDSQDVGIVCNLPEKYKVDGLKITFSGKYFDYNKDDSQKLPGQTYYILELNKIVTESK